MIRNAAVALALFLAASCGEGGSSTPSPEPDAVPDVAAGDAAGDAPDGADPDAGDLSQKSWYSMTITTQTNPGSPHEIEFRDLTEKHDWYSFGSTHIGTAVAFSVTDTWSIPFRVITFDFGKVVEGATADQFFEQETTGPGHYDFLPTKPPAIEVFVDGLQYRSTEEGSTGGLDLTDFGDETGEVMAGTFAGTLLQVTDKETKLHVDVEGEFHFVLPQKDSGQPN